MMFDIQKWSEKNIKEEKYIRRLFG